MTQPAPDWLADLQRTGQRMIEQSRQAQDELGALLETASSADRAITVTVGANGALRNLSINQRAMSRSANELSAAIMDLANQAQTAAARRAVEIVQPFAGETGVEFLRSQLPQAEDEMPKLPEPEEETGTSFLRPASAPARPRRPRPVDSDDDEQPPQTFLQRGF
ncbi:YbaB/EbfC family nucleoid-associated protein [Amycolatopsis anabasis]|uniref:YbaB/EbfC family nucleoid-associated protein n=1 Tax=Amycolatopsis anabasis TaxID=1840409 RepID=UPI00131C231A|nr:YbaB/EbfC family nucleoid-associated protein [Amycolatopsis anabasis]